MNLRHITRFTYTFTNFQGWRVAISRQGTTMARYFSDKQYGSEEEAREEAIRFRDEVLEELNRHPERTREILDRYRVPQPKKLYPAGLKPCTPQAELQPTCTEQKVPACSIRSNQVMHNILKDVCNRLQLDTASVLKLSLYVFATQCGESLAQNQIQPGTRVYMQTTANPPEDEVCMPEVNLQHLINHLESLAQHAGLPSFEEFSTGKRRFVPLPEEADMHNTSPPSPMHTLHMNPHVTPPPPASPHAPLDPAFLSQPLTAAPQHSLTAFSPAPIATGVAHLNHQPTTFAQGHAHSHSQQTYPI